MGVDGLIIAVEVDSAAGHTSFQSDHLTYLKASS